jgi:hypothetical protein
MDIVLKAYPRPEEDKKGAVSKWNTKVEILEDIYTGDYNHMIAGTAWGALNAMTERLDWYRSARKGNSESVLSGASGFDPMVNAEKNRLAWYRQADDHGLVVTPGHVYKLPSPRAKNFRTQKIGPKIFHLYLYS